MQDFEASFCAVFRVFTYEGVEIFWKKNHGCVELAKLYHFTYFFFNEVFCLFMLLLLLCFSLIMHDASVTSLALGAVHLEVLDD